MKQGGLAATSFLFFASCGRSQQLFAKIGGETVTTMIDEDNEAYLQTRMKRRKWAWVKHPGRSAV